MKHCAVVVLLSLLAIPSVAQSHKSADHPCELDPVYHKLDFWVGNWDVYDNHDGSKGGTDVVEKILDGCSIVENWHELSPDGADGKSLFYYQKAVQQWKQVWVTAVGPIKEKRLVEEFKDGGIRFQGEIPHPNGGSHLDRTTLTPVSKDRVHQVIEISRDGGKSWEVVFDAEYRRQK